MSDIKIALNRLLSKIRTEIPTKTSQLENDSGYLTSSDEIGSAFTTDDTLTLKNGVLSVNTAKEVEADNTLPVTSAAVNATVGNIEIILETI